MESGGRGVSSRSDELFLFALLGLYLDLYIRCELCGGGYMTVDLGLSTDGPHPV